MYALSSEVTLDFIWLVSSKYYDILADTSMHPMILVILNASRHGKVTEIHALTDGHIRLLRRVNASKNENL